MDTFAKTFDKMVAELPHKIISDVLQKKLHEKEIRLSKRKIDLMASRILKGEPIGQPNLLDRLKDKFGFAAREVVIEFTDKDTQAITATMDKFVEDLPRIVEKILETSPASLLITLKRNWKRESKLQVRDKTGFQKRLYERWGSGLEPLKMFITIAREIGANLNSNLRTFGDSPKTVDVLTRLHARACQIAEEVVCLLENGFSDGGMARVAHAP